MFTKILIANRGEIACRIIRTLTKMGISSVAVYSEADRRAQHVLLADEAIDIGAAPPSQSYLDIDKVITAAKDVGADAVHPGYGFLSENKAFVSAVRDSDMVFIGPGPGAIADMGDKLSAKQIARKAGVNVIPGSSQAIGGVSELFKVAQDIGYPVILKAAAGGGGKGMRVVESENQIGDLFERAASESKASFGDSRVFVEKYISQPRHVEIQVLADNYGNAVHLGERECSIQRRHQKVIEEAPSLALGATSRAEMVEQALALVCAVGYCSAGTVEFVVDSVGQFYFLEMNTRLQVEHPTTELITGIDLVEEMIHIAAGTPLRFQQDDIKFNGWAIEARVYAEDPERNYIPSTGRLQRYRPPEGNALRVDSGVTEGDEVSIFYDPMIAKLSAFGANRAQAILRLRSGLDRFVIMGVNNNVSFLNAVLGHDAFCKGQLSTDFLQKHFPKGRSLKSDLNIERRLIAIAAIVHTRHEFNVRRFPVARKGRVGRVNPSRYLTPDSIVFSDDGSIYREQLVNVNHQEVRWVALIGERSESVRVITSSETYKVNVNGCNMEVKSRWERGDRLFEFLIDGQNFAATVDLRSGSYHVSQGGQSVSIKIYRPEIADLAWVMLRSEDSRGGSLLRSPMPGMIVSLLVCEGELVEEGQALLVVDAMKMENVLYADRNGIITRIHVSEGTSVAVDQVILEYE